MWVKLSNNMVASKLSFGNMTLEMNIFNICKQPGDYNDLQEVDFTEKLVHDQFQTTFSETEIDESDDLQMVYFQEESKANSWIPKIKELPPRSIESIPLSVQPPKPDLKSLPVTPSNYNIMKSPNISLTMSSIG